MEIQRLDSGVYVVRDDVFPFLGGGNKGRKMRYIERDILSKHANAVVTTGGIQSNHCRALAVSAARNGWACTLVLHGNPADFASQGGNAMIMRNSGAAIVFCEPAEIGAKMDEAMLDYASRGLNPYYVYGGGHTLEGGLAYADAVSELFETLDFVPDCIYLASGTGSTQAGILAGIDRIGAKTKVVGISVGRKRELAESVVSEFYSALCSAYDIPYSARQVTVLDDYLCGGYGQFSEAIGNVSRESLKKYGFVLDTTYTAKAFYGMTDQIRQLDPAHRNVFWHTGGILNYLAQT